MSKQGKYAGLFLYQIAIVVLILTFFLWFLIRGEYTTAIGILEGLLIFVFFCTVYIDRSLRLFVLAIVVTLLYQSEIPGVSEMQLHIICDVIMILQIILTIREAKQMWK
jgi:hypothetical protein